MIVSETKIPGVKVIEPKVFGDDRGFFMETWQGSRYHEMGIKTDYVQDNLSYSRKGVLRGLHLQNPMPQGKMVYVLQGSVFDVAVDVRVGSPTFGKWHGIILSAENKKQFIVPAGFAHGFCVMSEMAMFAYKCTEIYSPQNEVSIAWDDPDIGIEWPLEVAPALSKKDQSALRLRDVNEANLPKFCIQ
ncbi:MAG: dTDP-4-dehydrorhamnose 3,5-epimerase [Zetaproteobacteria bacterium]|nr:dTDP-4-dehydrorhamnose 3,5-epimerase [Pseudobdellovibrionaceae bacterium]